MFDPLPAGDEAAVTRIEQLAADIGYPLLIKAAAGGGGRGMRRVDDPGDLAAAVVAAARESEQAFGDGSVYLERLVEGGRHIEVQLLADSSGHVVALGERDCSTQRRHQKLVEEAPAPGLSRAQREELHEQAVKVARQVGLRNAATAEFLHTLDGSFYFLEVNARLQVEHGVTELVTGLDLVREQLFIAAGEPLSPAVRAAAGRAATPDRHAIELRISAEDPGRDFLPVPGVVTRWREPAGPGIRVDSGLEQGWQVPGDYDPMLSKVLAEAPDREGCLARARRAVDEFETGGVQTTLPFHAWLLAHPEFTQGRLRTDLVAREWDPEPLRAAAAERAADAVTRHVVGVDAGGTGQPETPGPCADPIHGWKPEPWA
jgi:acetyl/propionyl-CoA carboxylase alpha subunit